MGGERRDSIMEDKVLPAYSFCQVHRAPDLLQLSGLISFDTLRK